MPIYPAKYPPEVTPPNWNAMVDRVTSLPEIPGDYNFKNSASYVIWTDGTDYYANDPYHTVFGGPDDDGAVDGASCHAVINAAIQAAGQGGKIFVKAGTYTLTDSVVDDVGVAIEGEHGAGDLFFSDDGTYGGYIDKNGVTFIDGDGTGIDMFKIGYKTDAGHNQMSFGHRLKNLSFSGYLWSATPASTDYKSNDAISCQNIQSAIFENIACYHKDNGLYITATNDEAPLNYSDVIKIENFLGAYNRRGIKISAFGGEYRLNNIYGYVNQYNCLYAVTSYDLKISNVFSNADGLQSAVFDDGSAIRIGTVYGDIWLKDATVNGYTAGGSCYAGVTVSLSGTDAKSKAFLQNLIMQGLDSSAIHIASGATSGCSVFIRDLYTGSPSTHAITDATANSGDVGGSAVYNDNAIADVKVYVDGGYADSEQAKIVWFRNCHSVKNVENFNQWGLFTPPGVNFFDHTNDYIGLSAANDSVVPVASTDYIVNGLDLFVSSTDSGNGNCAIIIKDPAGNTITTAASTLQMKFVPIGYKINWGAFTGAAPTVYVYGV